MNDKVREFTFTPGLGGNAAPLVAPKPLNCRTAKTIWKERRRRAELPCSMQKRLARA